MAVRLANNARKRRVIDLTVLIITGVLIVLLEIALVTLKVKLYKQIEQTDHKDLLSTMYLPKKFWKPFEKPDWTPVKYIFKRKHIELNNKVLTNLSDLMMIIYLVSWCLTAFFVLRLSVFMPFNN